MRDVLMIGVIYRQITQNPPAVRPFESRPNLLICQPPSASRRNRCANAVITKVVDCNCIVLPDFRFDKLDFYWHIGGRSYEDYVFPARHLAKIESAILF